MKGVKIWVLSAVALITLAGCGGLALANVSQDVLPSPSSQSMDIPRNPSIKTMRVTLIVLSHTQSLELPLGATVNNAVESVAKIKYGVVCSDNRDIQCINGLCQDPYKNYWWVIKVNGNSQNYSSHSRLSPGDVVELFYSGRIEHRRLREWLLSFSKGK